MPHKAIHNMTIYNRCYAPNNDTCIYIEGLIDNHRLRGNEKSAAAVVLTVKE